MPEVAQIKLKKFLDSAKPNKSKLARYLQVSPPIIDKWADGIHRISSEKVIKKILDDDFESKFNEFESASLFLHENRSLFLAEMDSIEFLKVLSSYVERPDWCFPYAGGLFPGGSPLVVLRKDAKNGRKEEIMEVLSSAPFRSHMSACLQVSDLIGRLAPKSGNISGFSIATGDLTFVVRVFGRWSEANNIEENGTYYFDDALIAICPTSTYRPPVVQQRMDEMVSEFRRRRPGS
jgi:hypothetical protein